MTDQLPNLWPERTEEERRERIIVEVYGNLHMEYPEITREQVAERLALREQNDSKYSEVEMENQMSENVYGGEQDWSNVLTDDEISDMQQMSNHPTLIKNFVFENMTSETEADRKPKLKELFFVIQEMILNEVDGSNAALLRIRIQYPDGRRREFLEGRDWNWKFEAVNKS